MLQKVTSELLSHGYSYLKLAIHIKLHTKIFSLILCTTNGKGSVVTQDILRSSSQHKGDLVATGLGRDKEQRQDMEDCSRKY